MANGGVSIKGQIFNWFLGLPYENGTLNSCVIDMNGTNLKWVLSVTSSYKCEYKEFFLSIKLTKCHGEFSEFNYKAIIFTTIDDKSENSTRSEVIITANNSTSVYDIFFAKKTTSFISVEITCVFIPTPSFYMIKDITTQVSDECFQSQNKRKCIDDISAKPTESTLKSIPHLESLSEDIGEMLAKSVMTDIELTSGEVSIPAHRAVLMSRSKVFSSMFGNEMVESITGSINIKDIEPSILQEFVKYLYSGKISEDLDAEVILELYKASDKYEVQSLQRGCRSMLVSNLTEENCFEILMLGDKHSDQQLKDSVVRFIIQSPALLKSDAWNEFSDNFPKLAIAIYRERDSQKL